MKGKRAYFPPSSESANRMSAELLFGEENKLIETSFHIKQLGKREADSLPKFDEIVLSPVKQICVSAEGYEITGNRKDIPGIVGKLTVNTTVDPPLALYTESEAINYPK